MSEIVFESTEETRTYRYGGLATMFFGPLKDAWTYRELIMVILRRELAIRFKATVIGPIWAVISPLAMLAVYMVALSSTVGNQVTSLRPGSSYPLMVFVGLVVFNLFAELASRAPLLMQEHLHYIKRSIFPSTILAWIAVMRALVYAAISFALLLIFALFTMGKLPWTIILLPAVFIPMILALLGMVWFMSALGSFTRDLAHLMSTIVPIFIFITPVFFVAENVPEAIRPFIYCNLLAGYVEMTRDMTLFGVLPNVWVFVGTTIGSLLTFVIGHTVFTRYKDVLVDVI